MSYEEFAIEVTEASNQSFDGVTAGKGVDWIDDTGGLWSIFYARRTTGHMDGDAYGWLYSFVGPGRKITIRLCMHEGATRYDGDAIEGWKLKHTMAYIIRNIIPGAIAEGKKEVLVVPNEAIAAIWSAWTEPIL